MDNTPDQGCYALIKLFGHYHLEYALRPDHLTRGLNNIAEFVRNRYFQILCRFDNLTDAQGKKIRIDFARFQNGEIKLEKILRQ